jgi:hypothetical protein
MMMFEMYPSGKELEETFEQAEKELDEIMERELGILKEKTGCRVEINNLRLKEVDLKKDIKNKNVVSALARFKGDDGNSDVLDYDLKLISNESPLALLDKIFKRYHKDDGRFRESYRYGLIVKMDDENLISFGIDGEQDAVFFHLPCSVFKNHSTKICNLMNGLKSMYLIPEEYGRKVIDLLKKDSPKIEKWKEKKQEFENGLRELDLKYSEAFNEPLDDDRFKPEMRFSDLGVSDVIHDEINGMEFKIVYNFENKTGIPVATIECSTLSPYKDDKLLIKNNRSIRLVEYGRTLKSYPLGFFYYVVSRGNMFIHQNPGENLIVRFDNPDVYDSLRGGTDG